MLVLFLSMLLAAGAPESRAEVLLRQGKLAQAVEAAQDDARANPEDLEAQELWIDLMASLGLPERATEHYAKRVQQVPDDPNAHYLLGRSAPSADASRAAYEDALRLDPDHARAWMGLGAVLRASGDLGGAIERYKRAVDLDATLGEAWGALINLYARHGERQEARQLAEIAMLSVPRLAEPYLVYAALVPEHAEATLRKAIDAVPPDARVQVAWTELMLASGRAEAALAAAREAVALSPTLPGAQLALAFAEAMAAGTIDAAGYEGLVTAHEAAVDQRPDARDRYDALVTRYPKTALSWMGRAKVRVADDPEGARADLERALTLEPDNLEARAALGMMLLDSAETARAAELLLPAATARPHDASLQVGYARAVMAGGRPEAALARLDQVARLHPGHVDLAIHHALARSQTGDKEGAWRMLVAASERRPDIRLAIARAAAAKEAGHKLEAIEIYEELARLTGKEVFAETAALIRAEGP